jgi:glycerophosphoryl diester phosphodiesterase
MRTYQIHVVEEFIRSKVGENLETCEDGLLVTPDYACVVDGATSVTGGRWTKDNLTEGQWAARILLNGVKNLSSDCTPREIVDKLTKLLRKAYQEEGVLDLMATKPEERATASMILFSRKLKKLICVGDCQAAFLNQSGELFQIIQPHKHNDEVMSLARCMFLQLEIARGQTVEELLKSSSDPGRDFVTPLRVGQRLFQNNPKAPIPYQYWVLDGFPVADIGIEVFDVPRKTTQIILATDGYRSLYSTLQETEKKLQSLLKADPLVMNIYRSTKGVRPGAESFDDRTYLRIEIGQKGIDVQPVLALVVAVMSVLLVAWKIGLFFPLPLLASHSTSNNYEP